MITNKPYKPGANMRPAYRRSVNSAEWTAFGVQARAPEFLKQQASGSDDVVVHISGGVETIYVRGK